MGGCPLFDILLTDNTMENTQQKIYRIAAELREIYKTNEGPRLISELNTEFPNPRKLWNDAKLTKSERWGEPATSGN